MNKKLSLLCLLAVTVPVMAFAQQRPVMDRGMDVLHPKAVVASKGSWMAGGYAGINSSTANNYNFFVVTGINANTYNIVACPQFCYMIADNMGLGARIKFRRNFIDVDSANAEVSSVKISITNYDYVCNQYLGAVFYRYYLPLGSSGRFSAFVDAELALGGSVTKSQDAHSADVKSNYDTGFNAAISANGGLMAFLTRHLAIDVKLGLLELGYSSTSQLRNQVYEGNASAGKVNLMFDFLALNFGVYYYL